MNEMLLTGEEVGMKRVQEKKNEHWRKKAQKNIYINAAIPVYYDCGVASVCLRIFIISATRANR